jgi:hypothetical protein
MAKSVSLAIERAQGKGNLAGKASGEQIDKFSFLHFLKVFHFSFSSFFYVHRKLYRFKIIYFYGLSQHTKQSYLSINKTRSLTLELSTKLVSRLNSTSCYPDLRKTFR